MKVTKLLFALILSGYFSILFAQVPNTISYQGSLTDSDKNALNGSNNLTFLIYDTDGGGENIWSENHTDIEIANGIFSVILGSKTNLESLAFDKQYWLAISINGGAELQPRSQLTSVPYSLTTKSIPNNIVSTDKINSQAVTLDKISKTGAVEGKGIMYEGGNIVWKTPLSGSPSGSAGGDLSETYPNPKVAKIQGRNVSSSSPSSGQVLKWSGSQWAPSSDNSGGSPSGTASGDLSGSYPSPKVAKLQGKNVSTASPSSGQVLKWNGSQWTPSTDEQGSSSSGTVTQVNTGTGLTGGPVTSSGTISAQTGSALWNANKLQGKTVSTSSPSSGQVLKWSGSQWAPSTDEQGSSSSGTVTQVNAGTGLTGGPVTSSGTISAQTGSALWNANKLQGKTVSTSSPSSGQVLKWSGSQWAPSSDNSGGSPTGTAGGDLSGSYPNPTIASNAVTSAKIVDGTITTSDLNFTPLTNPYDGDFKATGSIQAGDPATTFGNGDIAADDDLIADDDLVVGDKITLGGSIGWTSQSTILDYTGSGASDGILWLSNLGKVKVTGNLETDDNITSGNNIYLDGSIYWTGTQRIIDYTNDKILWFENLDKVWVSSADLNVDGNLSKGAGSFKIDHPLDPENKYLYHSFVESPDMMNVYNGNIVLNNIGEAIVELPNYFEELNMEFRYQLTCIGGYANIYISSEVSNNQFEISGGKPGLKVSWQVTGIRKDPYAKKNRIQVEVDKSTEERGYYLHYKEYNQPIENSIKSVYNKEVK